MSNIINRLNRKKSNDSDNDIDFVITWVDGNDPAWKNLKNKYLGKQTLRDSDVDSAEQRYQSWDHLVFLLRGIEEFAPWVRNIYFVTHGHIPHWMNIQHPKLIIVKHSDYIPDKYLPTFSANPIELNLHRISGLSERFVYFNDDMFLTKPMKKSDFFVKGLPCDHARLEPITSSDYSDLFPHMLINVIAVINNNFNKNQVIFKNLGKWLNPAYGLKSLFRTLTLVMYPNFSGLSYYHVPSPFLKSTLSEVWDREYSLMDRTSSHKFRHIQDVNQYLFKAWQFANGNFQPKDLSKNSKAYFEITKQASHIAEDIRNQKYAMICINDANDAGDLTKSMAKINRAFNHILPNKSEFEL